MPGHESTDARRFSPFAAGASPCLAIPNALMSASGPVVWADSVLVAAGG